MRQRSDSNPGIVADVWGSLSSGSVATGTTVRPLWDVDLLGTGVMSSRMGTQSGTGGLLWLRAVQMFKSSRGVTVRVSIAEDDTTTVRHVAAILTRLLLYRDALEIARPDGDLPNLKLTGIGYDDTLLIDAGRYIDTAHVGAVTRGPSTDATAEPTTGQTPARMAEHARLARELRNATGLPAATLGAALGVTREQYQRWLRGDPISTIRHGLLSYLHTIAADAARRLGPDRAHVWWRTPAADGIAPDQRLRDRLTDDVHQLVTALPDPAPLIDDVLVALPAQQPLNLGDYDDLDEDDPADERKSETAAVHDEYEYSDDSSLPDREEDHTGMTVAAVEDTNWLEPEKLYLCTAPDCETDRPVFQGDVFCAVTLPQLPSQPVPPGPSQITFVESLCMVVPHPCQCYHGDDIRPRLTVAPVRPQIIGDEVPAASSAPLSTSWPANPHRVGSPMSRS